MDKRHQTIKELVSKELSCSGHNMDHVMRVYNLCILLAKYEENVDEEILIPSVLLHDIARVREDADTTGATDHAILGATMAEEILKSLNYTEEAISKIKYCIISHRFRSGREPETVEAKILFDADKLDAIGAVGLARSFMLTGQFRESMYIDVSIDEYVRGNVLENGRIKDYTKHSPNIEFEVKLKKIPERLYTKKAKEIARERAKFMEVFFERLKGEIDGEI